MPTPNKTSAVVEGRIGALTVVPFQGAMGAEIRGLDLRKLDDQGFKVLHQAYLDHLLVLIRDQDLTDEAQVAVSRRFGPLEMPPTAKERSSHQRHDGPPEVTVVSNIKVDGVAIGELGDGEVIWHSDFSFREVIAGMRMLRAVELPPSSAGGNTRFCNCYAGYDALPPRLKNIVHGRTIKHDTSYDTNRNLRRGAQEVTDVRRSTGPSHPIVSTHPDTGCNSLFLGRGSSITPTGFQLKTRRRCSTNSGHTCSRRTISSSISGGPAMSCSGIIVAACISAARLMPMPGANFMPRRSGGTSPMKPRTRLSARGTREHISGAEGLTRRGQESHKGGSRQAGRCCRYFLSLQQKRALPPTGSCHDAIVWPQYASAAV